MRFIPKPAGVKLLFRSKYAQKLTRGGAATFIYLLFAKAKNQECPINPSIYIYICTVSMFARNFPGARLLSAIVISAATAAKGAGAGVISISRTSWDIILIAERSCPECVAFLD